MPKSKAPKLVLTDRQRFSRIVTLLAIVAVILLGWLWWSKVYESPSNVFWGMLNNNLSTSDFTKEVSETATGASLNETIQVNLGQLSTAHAFSTVKQGSTTVKTEEINTPTSDYVRYISIKTNLLGSNAKPLNFTSLLGIWGGALDSKSQESSQLISQTLLGIIPIGKVSAAQRANLIALAKEKNVYSINLASVKHQSMGGRSQYLYTVSVSAEGYIELLQAFSKDIGLTSLNGIQPESYAADPSVSFGISIDVLSRDLTGITYPNGGQKEIYTGYGIIQPPLSIPTKTISPSSLEAKLEAIR